MRLKKKKITWPRPNFHAPPGNQMVSPLIHVLCLFKLLCNVGTPTILLLLEMPAIWYFDNSEVNKLVYAEMAKVT